MLNDLGRGREVILIGKGPDSCLDNERQKQDADNRNDRDPEKNFHRGIQRVCSAGGDASDEKWSGSSNDATNVVSKSGTGSAQPRWK